jgi:non-ribosomal peptide synthetase component E (peptide arylation enzyme)
MTFQTRLTQAMSRKYRGAGLWTDETLCEVLAKRAATTPDREALYDGTNRQTYRKLAQGVDRMAARLRSLGVNAGDIVTVQIPNWIEFAYVFFALERLGAVAIPVSVDFRSREVDYIMRFAASTVFICCDKFRDFDHVAMFESIKAGIPGVKLVANVRGPARPGVVNLDETVRAKGAPAGFVPVPPDVDGIMRMAFTSGTTGNPKGVTHNHNTTLAAARILNGDQNLGEDEVMLIYLPLGLNWGYLTLVQAIFSGARAVLLDRFRASTALELIQRERVTYVPTAPASITAMLNDPNLASYDLSSLRLVITGGASAPIETIRAYRRHMKGTLLELYGMLETGYHTYTRKSDDPEKVTGSCGKLASHMGLRIVDDQFRDLPQGATGEILCDGPSVHLGYHNNPAANAELFTPDGWFRTGDLGLIDESGNLRIVGRLKEIINRAGKKFFPREIEEILYQHPKVMYCALVGVPDPRLGERNHLFVVPKGEAPTLDELVAYLGDSVATYKLPERLEIVPELPFTPTGKIQRHVLVKQLLARESNA